VPDLNLKVSVIIPVLNEANHLPDLLRKLQVYREQAHEIVVVDGGSSDGTAEIAEELSDQVVRSDRGRATQMNSGARIATGDILLFLHADTILPANACELIGSSVTAGKRWGRFDVRLSGSEKVFRLIEALINWRSRITSIATGDQAIFISRELFDQVGGFPEIPLMEDVAMSKRLKRMARPACLDTAVVTSSRRWEEHGVLRTVLLMWWLRLLYFIGVSPCRLRKLYS